jgi:hypothetical protein
MMPGEGWLPDRPLTTLEEAGQFVERLGASPRRR